MNNERTTSKQHPKPVVVARPLPENLRTEWLPEDVQPTAPPASLSWLF